MSVSESQFNKKFLARLPKNLTKAEKEARLEAFKKDLYTISTYILNKSTRKCYRLRPSQTRDLEEILSEAYQEYYCCTQGSTPDTPDLSPFPKTCRLEELLKQAEEVKFDPTVAYHIVTTQW